MSNKPNHIGIQQLMDEALNWFVILQSGHYTLEQERQFKEWLHSSVNAQKVYADVAQTWEHSGFTDELLTASFSSKVKKRLTLFKTNWVPLASFTFVAICMVGLLFQSAPDTLDIPPPPINFASTHKANEHVELADGSTIILSGSSAFSMVGGLDSRYVEFERGAANFSIKSNPDKPFIVKLDNVEVVVTGTTFEIRKTRDEVRVSLFEGSVHLRNNHVRHKQAGSSGENKMKPGERITIDLADNRFSRSSFDASSLPSWIDERLEYKNVQLSNIVKDINRYRTVPIRLSGSEIGDIKVTASLKTNQTDSFIAGLETTHNAKIIDAGSSIILSL